MCRFLLAQSKEAIYPEPIIQAFADMAQKSKAFDGDWQGDGWGASWIDKNNEWQVIKTLKPIWEERSLFNQVPQTTVLTIHARSASFPAHKGVLEYNQPYISGDYSFVFNGLLKGVSLPSSILGTIGAQKIWSLLQNFLKKYDPEISLEKVKQLLIKNTKEIQALNIGLATKEKIYALNYYTNHPDYYTLHSHRTKILSIISSEPLEGYKFSRFDSAFL